MNVVATLSKTERVLVMLKRFKFRNCYSFKDETEFSMKAVYAMKDNCDFIVEKNKDGHFDYVLPVAAIYGANAGGKSNLIRALIDAAQNICERGYPPEIRNRSFLITDAPEETFEHQLNLLIGEYEYEYSYSANEDEILTESLKRRDIGGSGAFENIFTRESGNVLAGKLLNDSDKGIINVINASPQKKESLVVNLAGALGMGACVDIVRWCGSVLSVTRIKSERERKNHLDDFASNLANDPETKARLSMFINKLDPAIGFVEPVVTSIGSENSPERKRFMLGVFHKSSQAAKPVGFPVNWESNGTQKVLELFAPLMDALDNGTPLVYDELDIMLHPIVFKKIVALFNDKETNPKHAQLIFAAHNTVVMNREDLRRDEIHIVEKNNEGISTIYRISDIVDEKGKRIRMDARYDQLYSDGVIGSFPEGFLDAKV